MDFGWNEDQKKICGGKKNCIAKDNYGKPREQLHLAKHVQWVTK